MGLNFPFRSIGQPNSTRNASFDFVPDISPNMMFSNRRGSAEPNFLMNDTNQMIWDIQKELMKNEDTSRAADNFEFEPIEYGSTSNPEATEMLVDGMSEAEVTEALCTLFQEEPSLEETYGS